MLSTFKLQTLKQKLWAIVAASFVARVTMFFALPSTPSSLAPDEDTYAFVAKWVANNELEDKHPYYTSLYHSGRSIIVPASIFYRIGFNELDAVRLVSTIYGLCSLILVVLLILKLNEENTVGFLDQKFNGRLIVGLVILFAFLPSHFFWSNLGLRESATEFWILATFANFFLIYHFQKRITAQGMLALVASIAFTFSSRPQVGWVLGISLIAFLLFNLKQINTYF